MRILHTADWHLGKSLHGHSLLEDQARFLDLFVDMVKSEKPDVLLLAGDVYDRSVPPSSAVELFSDTLERLASLSSTPLPLLIIAGNHDCGERLSFASDILRRQALHIAGAYHPGSRPVLLEDQDGPVAFHLLPYLFPAELRAHHPEDDSSDHQALTQTALQHLPSKETSREVLVAHAFVDGGEESDSERPLSIGGSGAVPAVLFERFQYTALGHLHAPQSLSSRIRYPGSPLKYSFSEHEHEKSVSIVELDAAGECRLETLPLRPRTDLRVLEGSLKDLLQQGQAAPDRDDYLLIRLTDTEALLDPFGKLKEVFPHLLHLERPGLQRNLHENDLHREDLRKDDVTLFQSFFHQVTGEPMNPQQVDCALPILDPEGRLAVASSVSKPSERKEKTRRRKLPKGDSIAQTTLPLFPIEG
ncbi:MAG: exonuclease SbcCD subunit D [Verrucomicrobiota bacterium]